MPNFIGSLDQGTTSTRFMIFSHEGAVVSSHQLEHAQIYPQPGWVEHDPMEIWDKSQEVIRVGMSQAGISADEIAALGITNQRETTILWNRFTGKQYHNAIVWQDTRTSSLCDQLAKEGGQDRFREKTGLPLATYFSGPKIRWLLENLPGLREEAEAGDVLFGTIDSWLIWNLTGGAHVTDVTNASRTMLMNLGTLDWDEELLSILEVPRVMLPEIKPSSTPNPYGYTLADGPFQGEVPICGNLGDQQAALFGQTCFRPGEAKNTYGTGCFMLINTGSQIIPSSSGLLTTVGYKIGDEEPVYALEGSIAIGGALIQWLRDNLGVISSVEEVEALAETVSDNGGIYFVPAFSGLFAPYWKSDARGVIVGMTGHTNKGHIARAALEATAFQTLEVLNAMEKDSGVVLKSLKVDGGMVVNNILMQFQADVLGVPVMRPIVHETTALGAAYAAGLAVGFWEDTDELRQHWKVDKEWQPQMEQQTRDELIKNWLKAVTRTFDWAE